VLLESLIQTASGHLEIDSWVADKDKDLVLVELTYGAKRQFEISRKEVSRYIYIPVIESVRSFDRVVWLFRREFAHSLNETGFAHFELDWWIINKPKDIVRLELMSGTKYRFTVSRKEVLLHVRTSVLEGTRPTRLGF
jgi:hypothetical protein